jgi:serine/threonine protein kinase
LLDENLNAKIGDFGLARYSEEGINVDIGSGIFRAPEICMRKFPFHGEKADIFALAVILFIQRTGRYPVKSPKYKNPSNIIEYKEYQLFA